MNRAPRGGIDLSFLNEEEAKQIFQVLERDAQLKKAEKERISKLDKKKEEATGLPGVNGEWFEEIQKRKFQNDSDASRMFKQPLAHRLRKAIGNDSTNTKPSSSQKHGLPSILGGLRTPFASLFSFRKSKRHQPPKPQQKSEECNPRYDRFAAGAHMSSKPEEMAKTETLDSPLPSEPAKMGFEANQAEMLEDSTCTWNEQLENELLRVLGSLDDQLAREQSQETVNRRTPIHYDSRASELSHYPTISPHGIPRGVQRNDPSMFLSDGTRTLRARDNHRTLSRPRVFYDTYMKRHHTADYTAGDTYVRRSPALRRENSTRSLGHSSEGSLKLHSGPNTSGFGHKNFATVNRSCSLSCLARGQSLASVDQLSTAALHYPLENDRGFTQRNYRRHTKRTPLSSIVWNQPQSSENSPYADRLLRTQSLMEFGPTFEDTLPCSPRENTRYEFYRSKEYYRRVGPNRTHSVFAKKHVDPLYFDNQDNYLLHQMERNSSKSYYRYPSFHGRMNQSPKSFPSGRTEEHFLGSDSHRFYSDEVFVTPDTDFEMIPSNLSNWPNVCMKKSGSWVWDHDSQDHIWGVDHLEGLKNRLFSKHPDGIQRHTAYDLYVPKSQTKQAVQQNLLIGADQNPSKTVQTNEYFQVRASEEVRNPAHIQSGKMEGEPTKGEKLRLVSRQRDTSSPAESHISPSLNSSSAALSRKPTKLTSIRNIDNIYLSNIHKREGQRNQGDCSINSDLDQMHPSYLTAKSTRAMNQNSQQEKHQSENLGTFIHNKASGNICSAVFSKGPEVFAHDELPYSCAESIHKHNRFVKHGTSNSISGPPSNSPPKSPTKNYTFPRKSASIDGSVLSEKSLSQFHPSRQTPYRNEKHVGDYLEALGSSKMENIYSKKRDKITLNPAHSSLNPSFKDLTCDEIPQTKDSHLQLTQDSKHSLDGTSTVASKLEKEVLCDPDKSEMSEFSECEEMYTRNPLKQYKTTSTLTVSIEEDNVKYQELISVYYTLPRKRSRTLCNLFLDDTKMDAESSSPTKKSSPPQKKYVHVHLATVSFPSSSEKGKCDSLGKISIASDMQQNSKMSSDATKEGTHIPDTTTDRAPTILSPSMVHNKDETVTTEESEFAFSNRIASLGFLSDSKSSKIVDDSLCAVTNTLCNQHVDKGPSPLNKGSKIDTSSTLKLSNSTHNKTTPGNLVATSSAMNTQKGRPLLFPPSTEPVSSNNSHIPHSVDNNKEITHIADSEISTTDCAKDSFRQDAKNKENVRFLYHSISRKADKLQLKNESVSSSRQEVLTSETKVCSDFQKQTPLVDVASTVHPEFQLNKSASEYRKSAQEAKHQNSVIHKICKASQRSETYSTNNHNPNSKDQLISTTQGLSDDSASENKQSSDCTKDKTSDIEKRKNRPSIKNKLAAIYKTSRKFSSKKSLTLKPHISNIVSQNDSSFSETSNCHSMLISSDTPQVILQTENEKQSQNPLTDEFENTALEQPENKKSVTNEAPSLITNEIRRPFANLCNQKHEIPSLRLSDKKPAGKHSTILFSKEIMPKLSSHSETYDKGLENNNPLTFSRITDSDLNQKNERDRSVGEPVFSPLSSDKSSNILTANYSKATVCPPQEVISPTESDHYQNIKRSSRLRNPSLSCDEPVLNPSKTSRERHFSENSYTSVLHNRLSSGGNTINPGSRYNRKFKSHSELLSCDENENWDACDDNNRTFGSRRVMYPSIEFGIFGKEQQQIFLDNIKRSLTEGRLWRPYFLSNPRSLRREESISLSRPELLSSGFAERKVSAEGASPRVPSQAQGQDSADYSDTNSDTTTDDEYYLDGNDKESEL
ncbi:exophilin-5 isoform X1 [Pogona vitticeps]